ncbi:MBL fold metallo-hydrolase [Pediococcus argentinicus]|uniref:Metallo-beta-lactamase domain-containing protein n=1 Tax=Pediococcus argentinicus TaxID=480391 RepID=A0A0R2NH67_9LACO|nr:MBL fold metallo-hydrolase [Pediococcus argentinicus]KRO22106.1 hypothetical protein IV88_GL001295 [Pediococcus argentinicus]NKZ22457.1 MBL fold metallo-hydrolase [Pediococcus argentinicus]GEP20205.1 MBL fold metallo-hydrolase [Pediococcus argentinicus]
MTELKYETLSDVRKSVTRGIPKGTEELEWVSNTATLIYGNQDAVLIDTFMTKDANLKLVDWIKGFDVNLKYIYITHAHSDHFFGTGIIKDAFPNVKIIATQETADGLPSIIMPAMLKTVWQNLFPNQIPEKIHLVDELVDGRFYLEDEEIKIVKDGFTDTHDSTSLWIPSLGLIVAGDATYNGVHPFMAETTQRARENWINVNEELSSLNPKYVVAGHKNPDLDDNPKILLETAEYIRTFNNLSKIANSAEELYKEMLEKYPTRINPGSLWGVSNSTIR